MRCAHDAPFGDRAGGVCHVLWGETEAAAWAVALLSAAAERVAPVSDLEIVAPILWREGQGGFGEGSCWEGRWVLDILA